MCVGVAILAQEQFFLSLMHFLKSLISDLQMTVEFELHVCEVFVYIIITPKLVIFMLININSNVNW